MKISACELCGRTAVKSSIVGDIYYRHLCATCYSDLIASESPSSGEANYNRGRDYEDHLADIIQPYTDGKPDAEFIHLYPEKAHQMWSQEEIDQATRS